MSFSDRVKQGFLRLPTLKKGALIASFALAISAVLPWFKAKNLLEEQVGFLGVTGPLYLIGLFILGFGLFNFLRAFLPITLGSTQDKPAGRWTLWIGTQGLLLISLALSIFKHPDFASHLLVKTTRFGLWTGLISSAVLLGIGFLLYRQETAEQDVTEEKSHFVPTSSAEPTYSLHETIEEVIDTAPVSQETTPGTPSAGIDPLTLDPKERYRLLRARQRQAESESQAAQNLWQKH